MSPSNGDDDYSGVKCDEIPWTSDPIDPFETSVDVLALDVDDLLVYARTLQSETRNLRELLREADCFVSRDTEASV